MGIWKGIGVATGATATGKIAGGILGDFMGIWRRLRDAWQAVTRPRAAAPTLPDDMSPEARFRVAMGHYSRIEQEAARRAGRPPIAVQERQAAMRTATARSAFLMAFLTVGSVAGVAWLFYASPVYGPVAIAARLVFPIIPAALALRAAYVNYCVRNGRLDTLGVFLRSGDFLPRP